MDSLSIPEVAFTDDDSLEALAPSPSASSAVEAQCHAFMGASGGVGTTTLAIQMAHELMAGSGETEERSSVCLIDMDFETGACAHYLDVQAQLSLSDLAGNGEDIDESYISAVASHHTSGMTVIAMQGEVGDNDKVNAQAVLTLLDQACRKYDHVVLDVPRYLRPWTLAVMQAVDHLALVTELTVPAIHIARRRLSSLSAIQATNAQLTTEVILNRVERRAFRNAIRIPDAEKALGQPVAAAVCVDHDLAQDAMNCGDPCGVVRPNARLVKDLRRLCDAWRSSVADTSQHL